MIKIRQILNKGALLNYALCMMNCALIVGCSGDENLSNTTLTGEGKTPLVIEASLSTGNAVTRATGNDFAENDVLLAYLRHTTGPKAGEPLAYPVTSADQAPKLVSFTLNKDISGTANYSVSGATDLTTASPLYWDDFSDSRNAATDLRTSGHGLQSYYGYCYNGGASNATTALTEATGVLGWTIGNQTTAEAVQHADLLWSAEQETVTYGHAATQGSAHGTLTIPYTHAMSEVTVTVTCSDGFSGASNPLVSTVLTLNAMNTVTTFTAPTQSFTSGTPTTVQMFGEAYTSGTLTRNFTAIVAPGTKLKEGVKLLDIVNVEDNNYTLNITGTSDMLGNTAWATGHTVQTDDGNYILTKPGYNYHLDITVSKTAISVIATLQDWTPVNATGTGVIQYPNDVVSMNVTGHSYADNSSFSLFWQQTNGTANDEASERTNATYTYATVPEYSGSVWSNTPAIYWPNQTNQYYFRALAQFNSTTNDVHDISEVGALDPLDKGTAVSQGTIAGGHDILWGTTPAHTGNPGSQSFTAGQAIPPRTGNVPIAFEHAMSKVTFNLVTSDMGSPSVNNDMVDLTDATIAISNLYTSGTIAIEDGSITPAATKTATAITATTAPISELIVIPQTIGDDAIVTITLADGTTYKLQLNQCDDTSTSTAITQWQRGKNYTYTIRLTKEMITFRALIQDWEQKAGSGNANLEWD